MQQLTPRGRQVVNDLAHCHGVSEDAVLTLLEALWRGQGTMAQFSHPELGGSGQWMRGGMIMVGDMFNAGLKARIDGLCMGLSNLLASHPFEAGPSSGQAQGPSSTGQQQADLSPSGNWWPAELGVPSATGGQNHIRYAYFAGLRRLAVETHGHVTVYDTLDHHIGGVSQQQGPGNSVVFTSQRGTLNLKELPVLSIDGVKPPSNAPTSPPTGSGAEVDLVARLERLAELRTKGLLTEDEFVVKKAELLGRL